MQGFAITARLGLVPGEISLGEAAERFNVSRSTLTYAAQRGHLVARKIGAQWVTTAPDVETWLAHGKHVPGPTPVDRPPKRRPGRPRKIDAAGT